MDEKNKKAWQDNREKKQTESWQEAESRMERSGCVMWKKYYGSDTNITKAVDRVSFCVQKGEFVGIMGASGSGKTTLLNMLSTIDRVTAGHIYYGETDITELSDEALAEFRKDNLGFIFQDYNLLDTLTIEENIVLAMTLHSKSKREIQEKM